MAWDDLRQGFHATRFSREAAMSGWFDRNDGQKWWLMIQIYTVLFFRTVWEWITSLFKKEQQ